LDENILRNLVRKGKVSSVDAAKRTARVIFEELDNMVSGDLFVLQHINAAVSVENTELSYDKSNVLTSEGHDHAAALGAWMPSIGQWVICLYVPAFNGDGFILGGL
jgi:hypothetical protein